MHQPSIKPAAIAGYPDVLFKDYFQDFARDHWLVETEQPHTSRVLVEQGRLIMDTRAGMTVWLRQPLSGAYRIEFLRQVLVAGQPNDRLSDMNVFWGAHDGEQGQLEPRDGVLQAYDSLATWYVGMGGNGNSTTRFRHYDGAGNRQLLGERLDAAHLLEAGRIYRIRIDVTAVSTQYCVDDELLFEQPLQGVPGPGYFGLRSVWSRQAISRFSVQRL